MNRSAIISDCGQYRYLLGRAWDISRPLLAFVMLNPSTADADEDDPTIRKCIGFAERLGFGGIVVANLFAFRATDPKNLRKQGYPVGPLNDDYITEAARRSEGAVICAWGVNARGLVRTGEVRELLRKAGARPTALRLTDDGIPWHPLMLPYTCTPVPLRGEKATSVSEGASDPVRQDETERP